MLWLLLVACTGGADTETEDTGFSQPDGVFCQPAALVGTVSVVRWSETGAPSFQAQVYDKPNPWLGQPTLSSEACAYHLYEPTLCEDCAAPKICALDGACVDPPRADPDAEVTLTADGADQLFEADEYGNLWGEVSGTRFAFDVTWSGGHVVSEELALRAGLVASVTSQGSYEAPGTLAVSWSGTDQGQVQTTIPMNHHASAPTFTRCEADADAGGFEVPAEMVDPLSVITGLEFQGLVHGDFAAAMTESGCVQLAVTTHHPVNVQFP